MRLTILAALTVTTLALSACGGEAPPPEAPAPPPPPPPVVATAPPPADTTPPAPPPKPVLADVIPVTLKSIGDAFNAHDGGKMSQAFTDDAAVYTYGGGETHSKGDLATGLSQLFAAFPDAKSAATRVWIKGNIAISEIVWSGTMTGDMGPFKATGKAVGAPRVHVMMFNDDGLIKEMHEYGDDLTTMMQAQGQKGAAPVPTIPTNPPEVHIGKGTPDEDKLVTWGKGLDDVWSKADPKALVALFADDGDMSNMGAPAAKGGKALLKEVTPYLKAFPDAKFTPTNAWGIDGFAIVEHMFAGTHKGALGPFPASKKSVNVHVLDIWQPTADGKVQHDWGYFNMVEMLAQTGQLPKPPAPKPAAPAPKPAAPAPKH
jgi:steroid delta-isomerase-like uncharacterized protein